MTPKKYVSKDGGSTFYYRDPEMTVEHRERGLPALKYFDGDKTYVENDLCHRLDGFAGDSKYCKEHFLNGKPLFNEEIEKQFKL